MAIEKMKFLSVIGKEDDIDNFLARYILNSGIHPESPQKVFEKGWKISYFVPDTKPKDLLKRCNHLKEVLQIKDEETVKKKKNVELSKKFVKLDKSLRDLEKEIEEIERKVLNLENIQKNSEKSIDESKNVIEELKYLKNVPIELQDLYNLKYMKFRYGKLPIDSFEEWNKKHKDEEAIVLLLHKDEKYCWIMYFTTKEYESKIDAIFNILNFERIWLSENLNGKPDNLIEDAQKNIESQEKQIQSNIQELIINRRILKNDIQNIIEQLEIFVKVNVIKKYVAHDKDNNFYIAGWIPESKANEMVPMLEQEKIEYNIQDYSEVEANPPIHLKNRKIFKPFEELVEMYGLPNYNEVDPTAFVAITAFIMFGFMFGDIGHGLILAIIGIILKMKKINMGTIFTYAGISSIIFGFLYGSIFGKEDIIKSVLISPMENIQTMLISGISFGAILILIAMFINVINGIKNKDKGRIFFDSNGLAGIVFYVFVLLLVLSFISTKSIKIPMQLIISFIILSLILIMLKNPLTKLLDKKREAEKGSIAEKIFEIVEMILSFVSNTISFVRLAAFAINHVGLCMAVYILSNMLGGAGSIIVQIIGNVIVIVLEGLIVGIQVLRLEYYELFSRFYTGDGKEYKPVDKELIDE